MGSETQPASLEEWTRDWASDLKKAVEESGINLDRLRLDDIEPGVPSDWVREAIDLNYEVWLPAPAEAGRSQRAQAPAKEPEGDRAKRRAQYVRVQQCYDKDRTRCAQQNIAGNWCEPPASLPMSVQEPFWRDIFKTPSVSDSQSLPVVGELHWELLHPITSEDVVRALKKMKDGAPGPDDRKLSTRKLSRLTSWPAISICGCWLDVCRGGFAVVRLCCYPSVRKQGILRSTVP